MSLPKIYYFFYTYFDSFIFNFVHVCVCVWWKILNKFQISKVNCFKWKSKEKEEVKEKVIYYDMQKYLFNYMQKIFTIYKQLKCFNYIIHFYVQRTKEN